MPYTYSLDGYGQMIADAKRTEGYLEGMRRTINPGAVVLDIGTGSGMFAMLACRCGAARVYAIDPSEFTGLARELAAANGYAHRIHFIQAVSTEVVLPEPVDVIVSDLHGTLPFWGKLIPTIVDARRRFLAPGGRLIPQEDTLWAAVVALPEVYRKYTSVWNDNVYGLDLRPARRLAVNDYYDPVVKPDDLLAPAQCWRTLDFYTVTDPNVRAELSWTVGRTGTAHGIALWFDALLAPGVSFSNRPGENCIVYGQTFFPWPEPVPVDPGDLVTVSLAAELMGDNYIWQWDSRILEQGRAAGVKAEFRQSSLFGVPLSPARIRQRTADHIPTLATAGRIARLVLTMMDRRHSLAEIARRLTIEFPDQFASEAEALNKVADLSVAYS